MHAITVKRLYLVSILSAAAGGKQLPKYETVEYSFEFSYSVRNKLIYTLSLLMSASSKSIFEPESVFQQRGNHVLKGTTYKGKNKLPMATIKDKICPSYYFLYK